MQLNPAERQTMAKVIKIREDELCRRARGKDTGECWVVEYMDPAGWMQANDGVPAFASRGELYPAVNFPIGLAASLRYIGRQKRYIEKQRRVNPNIEHADLAATLRARNLVTGMIVIA